MVIEITSHQLHELIVSNTKPFIIDVRRDDEIKICQIPDSHHIEMDKIPINLNKLPDESHVIVTVCHHGRRSYQVADYLQKMGYTQVMSLKGGIDDWAVQIDPTMKRY